MLDLVTIKKNYPENLQPFERFVLREYLQYKILQIIFDSEYGKKLCFLGGTALRVVYGNKRFSEDLDFDNFGLNEQDFDNMIQEIKRKMELEGKKSLPFRVFLPTAAPIFLDNKISTGVTLISVKTSNLFSKNFSN